MYQQIDHWSSHGLVYNLGDITKDNVLLSYHSEGKGVRQATHRKDSALGAALMHLKTDEIQLVMQQFRPSGASLVSGLTQLKAAFERKPVEGATAYSEETCVEFHQLLITVLVGY